VDFFLFLRFVHCGHGLWRAYAPQNSFPFLKLLPCAGALCLLAGWCGRVHGIGFKNPLHFKDLRDWPLVSYFAGTLAGSFR